MKRYDIFSEVHGGMIQILARKKLWFFFSDKHENRKQVAFLIETEQCSFRVSVNEIYATKISPYPCTDVNRN